MENAVKALMMAAGVLIGLMILSLGVTLFASMGEYMGIAQKQVDENAVHAFNEKFMKYVNTNNAGTPEFTLTIQDVVSAANAAYESNTNYGLTAPSEENYYVTINMTGQNNLEQIINDQSARILNENIEKKYICTSENVKTRASTSRVFEVTFSEYTY